MILSTISRIRQQGDECPKDTTAVLQGATGQHSYSTHCWSQLPEPTDIINAIEWFDRMPRSQRWQAIERWCADAGLTLTHYYRIRSRYVASKVWGAA